jgi:hypothetical protein
MVMRAFSIVVVLATCSGCARTPVDALADSFEQENAKPAPKQNAAEQELLEKLEKGPDKVQALEAVLRKSEELSPSVLRAAMLVALKEKRIEDGAFLLYAGLFRSDFDHECFPPEGLSALGPFVIDSLSSQLFGGDLTSEILNEPATLSKVIDRLKKWSPEVPRDYHPGYDFKERKSERTAVEATKPNRADVVRKLSDCLTLLNDPEYFAAFRVNQAYRSTSADQQPTKEENETATATMKRIEKAKGIKISLVE